METEESAMLDYPFNRFLDQTPHINPGEAVVHHPKLAAPP